jgi:hypothetical protein
MSSTTTTYAHQTKAKFLRDGFELTILESTTSGEEDCAICTRPIYCGSHPSNEPAEPGLRIKACGHVLGATCALKWFEEKNSCPFCRATLFPLVKVVKVTWIYRALARLNEVYESRSAREAEAYYEALEAEERGQGEAEEMEPQSQTSFWW